METITKKLTDNLELFQKRIEIISGAKLRDTDRISNAINLQDAIRAKVGKLNISSEIRKWRELR